MALSPGPGVETGGLAEAVDALRTRWRLLLLVVVPLLAGVTFYAERLPDEYESTAVIAFAPRPETTAGADVLRFIVPKYVAYLTGRTTTDRVARQLGEDPDTLASALDATIEPETANLDVTVRLDDPARAARAANALGAEAVSFSRDDDLVEGEPVALAVADDAPAGPPRRLIEIAGLVAAVILAVGLVFLLERGRPRVRSAGDAAGVTGLPVVGRVPRSRALHAAPVQALADPAVGAAVRSLRTHLDRGSRESPVGVLAVTSATSGEGKSTLVLALAAAVARLDVRVLVVDADRARPRLARLAGTGAGPGLEQLLVGEGSLDAVLVPVPDAPGLSLLPAGTAGMADSDTTDLLPRRLAGLLEEARRDHDLVVVDCPPLLGTDDARTTALVADATLLVVAVGTATAPVDEAAQVLRSLGVRVLGCVLNRSREAGDRTGEAYLGRP